MKRVVLSFSLAILLFSTVISAQPSKYAPTGSQKSTAATIERLEKDLPQLLQKADVPGLSAALVIDGKLVWSHAFGVKNAETKEPVTNETIFEAASLSKPVTAYAVLKLVDEGKIDLDTPLNKYLGNNYDVGDDERLNLITARRVLSHTSGFPNWRQRGAAKLPINFTPGEKFSYSGEGFVYLSKVVEKLTGKKFEDVIKETVFEPLGMKSSSFVWLDSFDTLKTYRHDALGKPTGQNKMTSANAAASLHTTAEDYARFVIAVLDGKGLKKATWEEMMKPQVKVNEKYPQISWGLGWGLETTEEGRDFWHWGDNGDAKAYITAYLQSKNAIVYFANGANGLSFTKEILDDAVGGLHPALSHLNYEKYDSPSRTLLKTVLAKGAAAALKDYQEKRKLDSTQNVPESNINSLGYTLLRLKKVDDAIEVFKQNTADFPQSGNAWDSLAEGYMTRGDKELAVKYYEKSLELDPNNKNAVEQLKKLKP